jgi:hypothetical protein
MEHPFFTNHNNLMEHLGLTKLLHKHLLISGLLVI